MSNYSDKSGPDRSGSSFRPPVESLGAFDRLAVFAAETVCDGHFERRVGAEASTANMCGLATARKAVGRVGSASRRIRM